MLQSDGVFARFFKKSILLNRDLRAAGFAGALARGIANGIKKIERKRLAEAFSVREAGVKPHINVLARKSISVFKRHIDVVKHRSILHVKLKIKGVAICPLLVCNRFFGFKKIIRAASAEAKNAQNEEKNWKLHII